MNKSLIIFGIVNITSDSFSDGGRYLAPDAAIAQARKLMAEGADVIDLGPASSNPDAAPVSSDTEIARIAPVLDALKADGIPVSLDSYQPATQAYALSRGVAYLNDIRGFPDAAFYPQLAKSSLPNSSLCIRCKTGRQIGARHPLATSWITLRRSLTRASRR